MSTAVIVGAQWGDEGKGKIIDFLAQKADMVVRSQGGNNAGHTVVCGDETYKLHLIPSGILYDDVECIIANGVVADLAVVLKELDGLAAQGIGSDNLRISQRAQMIMPYHCQMDALQETLKGDSKIGTTKRGIGPAYVDKIARTGFRLIDLMDWPSFLQKLHSNIEEKNRIFELYGQELIDEEKIIADFKVYAERIKPYLADTAPIINQAIDDGKNVLFEGAQGTLLDIDHGTYPYVTSSYPTAGGACTGSGVGPTKIKRVLGIAKSYTTRVGDGPFPTELFDGIGETIRQQGFEFGTTTGRPRRCGWFDAVISRYSMMINGLTDLIVTKLDVLDSLSEIKICTAYEYQGRIITDFPADLSVLSECQPIYESLPGWQAPTTDCRSFSELPLNAQKYLQRVAELSGVEISIVAVGPERTQTIVINEIF
ncbi:MAG: adenylosuccinate synthase [Bacillota bacterium]|jgi:adenylosuccinate synthase